MEVENKEQKFLRDTAVIGIGNILSKGIVFLLIPIHTAMLTPAEYGVMAMIAIFIAVSTSIIDSGFSNARSRRRYQKLGNISYHTAQIYFPQR